MSRVLERASQLFVPRGGPPGSPPGNALGIRVAERLRVRFVDSSQLGAPISDAPYTVQFFTMAEERPRKRLRCAGTPLEIELSIPSSSPAPPGIMQNLDRSVRSVEELRSVIEQEWEQVTLEEINEWIDEMLRLMNEVCERRGRPIVE